MTGRQWLFSSAAVISAVFIRVPDAAAQDGTKEVATKRGEAMLKDFVKWRKTCPMAEMEGSYAESDLFCGPEITFEPPRSQIVGRAEQAQRGRVCETLNSGATSVSAPKNRRDNLRLLLQNLTKVVVSSQAMLDEDPNATLQDGTPVSSSLARAQTEVLQATAELGKAEEEERVAEADGMDAAQERYAKRRIARQVDGIFKRFPDSRGGRSGPQPGDGPEFSTGEDYASRLDVFRWVQLPQGESTLLKIKKRPTTRRLKVCIKDKFVLIRDGDEPDSALYWPVFTESPARK